VQVEVRPLRQGGSSGVLAVTLSSGANVALAATVLAGRSRPGRMLAGVAAPAVPGPERCTSVELPVDLVPFLQHLDFRPAKDTPLLGGAAQAEFVGWLRLRDGSPLDAQVLTVLVDALPPHWAGDNGVQGRPRPWRCQCSTPNRLLPRSAAGCLDGSSPARRAVAGASTTATCGRPTGSCWRRPDKPGGCSNRRASSDRGGVTAAAGGQVADAGDQVARRAWQVLAVSAAGVFVVFVDATVVNIAFPALSADFPGVNRTGLSWVLNA